MRAEKGVLVKSRLIGLVRVLGADRAGAPGGASEIHAIAAAGSGQMGQAGIHLKAAYRHGAHRAGIEAGLAIAIVAGAGRVAAFRHREGFAEQKQSPVRMPEPVNGMDERAGRRWVNRFGALRPALKRVMRRAAERKQDFGPEGIGDRFQYAARPFIQRVFAGIRKFGAEAVPEFTAGIAGHDGGAGGGGQSVVGVWMKAAPA